MKPRTRRIIQATLYETIAIAIISPALALIFATPMTSTLALAIFMSAVALVWNYLYNGWFERWEAHQRVKERTLARRVLHALGFEGGLVVMLVPVMAYWLDISLWQAFVSDFVLLVFFLIYTFAFTWAFDGLVGLPESVARPNADHVV